MIKSTSSRSVLENNSNTSNVPPKSKPSTAQTTTASSGASNVITAASAANGSSVGGGSRVPLVDKTNNFEPPASSHLPKDQGKQVKGTVRNEKNSRQNDIDRRTLMEGLPSAEEAIQAYMDGNKDKLEKAIEAYKAKLGSLKIRLQDKDEECEKIPDWIEFLSEEISLMTKVTVKRSESSKNGMKKKICNWIDIDASDNSDPQSVVDYVNEIYDYMLLKEKENIIPPNHLSKQPDITEKMRGILVDWLVEVHRMFKLLPETLFLTVYIIDRFLHRENITRDQLQLVGITSMLISSKYEEIYAPECNDFVYISDGAYTKKQILEMENQILNCLGFKLTTPISLQFLRRYSKAAGSDYNVHSLCKYIIETMLLDPNIPNHPPSLIAASAVYIARKMTGQKELWNSTLEHYTSYQEEEVQECAEYVNARLKCTRGSSLKAIEKKYSLPKFGQVTVIPLVDV